MFHTSCIVCNNTSISPLADYPKNKLVQCSQCGFVFCSQIPTLEELNHHYSTSYSRNDFLSPITVKRYHEILDTFEPFRKTGNLLDIGCGIGYFLDVAKERGWKVYGTEYTQEALKINRDKGFTMHEGKLNAENYTPGFFDIVTSFEVIEHINNPQEDVANIKTILRSGGAFYATTPNFNSLSRYYLKEKWNVICYPEHLSYYSPKSIHYLFNSFGFKKMFIQTTGISITRLKKSLDSTITESHVQGNTSDESLREQMESKWYLGLAKRILNSTLTFFGVGDSLKIMYLKP